MTKPRETDLYPPIKQLLEDQGYVVKSEVGPMFFRLGVKDALVNAMRDAGCLSIKQELLRTELVYQNAEEACDAAFLGGPVALPYSRFSDAQKEAVRTEYLNSIDQFRDDGVFRIPGTFVVAIGTK